KIKSKNVVREQLALLENYSTTSNSYPKSTVFIGDVLKVMKLLPDETVDCIITSPPYWKQRDYKHSNQIGQESSYEEYIRKLVEIFNEVKRVLKSHGTLFLNIGYKYQEKELLLIPELVSLELQKNGWTLINKIIWFKPNAMPSSFEKRLTNVYEPIFFFVKRNSKHKYYFNLDEIRIRNDNYLDNKNIEEYIGYTVENSINKNKKLIGTIKNIHKDKHGNYFAEVTWDDGNTTFEIINDFSNVSKLEPTLICPNCNFELKNEFEIENHSYCNEFISVILPEKPEITNLELIYTPNLFDINDQTKIRRYNGKFKINPDNRGASPGARKSLFGEYFVVQRRFKVYQNIIADYLRFWKDKIGITIKEIDKILGYKDTAGHWFRKDSGHWGKGGSIPSPEDWFKLKEILKFDNRYDRWLTETHLVLQTVKAHPKGKNPGDVWQIKLQPFNEAHFAVFPEELVKNCILTGCPEKGIVLDPFAGSGTTGKVAEELGRSSILIELVPDFLDIIKKRVKNIDRVIYVK
ncbi:MAG: site-specific DNA-methyltransferase, partial [Ignavibacteria bacterium]|nr:site-specific DNA-methyltransferase [Ignavibacteria bacterium]